MSIAPGTIRTPVEINERIKALEESGDDFLGAQRTDMILSLPYADAKPFIKHADAIPEDEWTPEEPLARAREYMEFAIGKATDHRGLSAGRSVDHYKAWTWLLGVEGEIDWENYAQYGVPILKEVSALFEIPWPDDEALNRMAEGDPCHSGCMEGCG